MKMQRYEAYKDSGVEWIGDIPEEWELTRLANIGKFSASGIDKHTKKNEPKVKIVNFTDIFSNQNFILDSSIKYMIVSTPEENRLKNLLQKGDLIFLPSSETYEDLGASALVDETLENTSFSYHVIRFQFKQDVSHSFRKYFTNNHSILSHFAKEGKGTTRKIIGRNVFRNIIVAIPPKQEQTKIANFLDQKTTQIDRAISQKEQMIKLLKERRQILIHDAVTGKMNREKRKMKDSGVEWIGEIPDEWEVKKLKTCVDFVNRGSTPSYIEKSDVYVVNQATFSKGYFNLKNIKYTDETLESFYKNRGRVCKNDLLIASTGGGILGKVAYFDLKEGHFIADSHVTIIRTNKRAINKFYYYFFQINYDLINGILAQGSTNQTELQRDWLRNFLLPLPPLSEQKTIVNFIEENNKKIDHAITLQQEQIKKLKEYKITLIDSVVTGKVRVP